MNWALVRKTARDALVMAIFLTLGIIVVELGAVRMIIEVGRELEQFRTWLARPLVQSFIRIALGADLATDLTPTTMTTLGLGHPLLYVLSWALWLTIGTRVIAGEIDRGTADLLLALPMSRVTVYLSTSLVWAIGAAALSAAPLAGLWIGEHAWKLATPLDFRRLWPLTVNLWALNVAVASVTMLISSLVSRRGKAVGIVLTILLTSDLINLLVEFWEWIRPLRFLGFLRYYRVLPVVRSGQLPVGDIATLLTLAAVTWGLGLWYFSRRDIPAA